MFSWRKKRRLYRTGQQTAAVIVQEIDDRIAGRVIPASERFMDIMRQRFAMIWDDPVEPRTAVAAEWDEFEKALGAFVDEMKAEINIKSYKWDDFIEAAGAWEMVEQVVWDRLTAIKNDMMQQAAAIIAGVMSEIERRERSTNERPRFRSA
jgi:predicted ABC-class ATPase